MIELIISIVALLISAFGLYKLMGFEADSLIADCENLDIYDDLESRTNALEYGIHSNNKNTEVLASQISDLQTEVINLKNQINSLNRQMTNTSESINNFGSFVDKTRGMVDENTKRLDEIQGNVRN